MPISLKLLALLRGVPLTSFVLCGFQFLYPHNTVLATLPNAPMGVVSFFSFQKRIPGISVPVCHVIFLFRQLFDLHGYTLHTHEYT